MMDRTNKLNCVVKESVTFNWKIENVDQFLNRATSTFHQTSSENNENNKFRLILHTCSLFDNCQMLLWLNYCGPEERLPVRWQLAMVDKCGVKHPIHECEWNYTKSTDPYSSYNSAIFMFKKENPPCWFDESIQIECQVDVLHKNPQPSLFLRNLHTGTTLFPLNTKNIFELLISAEKYQVTHLQSLCEQVITTSLTVDTVVDILLFAQMHHMTSVKVRCIEFITKHLASVCQTRSWEKWIAEQNPNLLKQLYLEFDV